VGLLGELRDGQLGATLPLALEALADGGHVVALHPGLDLAVALGCGAIPAATAAASPAPLPSAAPAPLPSAAPAATPLATTPVLAPSPSPATMDPACVGVAEWAAATEARLDAIQQLSDEADRLAGMYLLPEYVAAIADFASGVQIAAADQASQAVPEAAGEADDQALRTYAALADAASLFLQYYTVEMSYELYGRATSTYDQAKRMVNDLRRETGRLASACEGP
jgi:hypothetical protein